MLILTIFMNVYFLLKIHFAPHEFNLNTKKNFELEFVLFLNYGAISLIACNFQIYIFLVAYEKALSHIVFATLFFDHIIILLLFLILVIRKTSLFCRQHSRRPK